MRSIRALALALVVVLAIGSATAYAWYADFFYDNSSGNGTYEAGFINPEALYVPAEGARPGKTFVVFQGPDLDPYIAAVTDAGVWEGPRKIGDNQLSTVRPLDTHGGPSIVRDAEGYLHVFYGGHNTKELKHAISEYKNSINGTWDSRSFTLEGEAAPLKATYPQPWFDDATGRIGLVYRRGDGLGTLRKMDWEVTFRSASVDATWTPAQTLVNDTDGADEFYVSSAAGADGKLHLGMIRRDAAESAVDQFARKDVYYMVRQADGAFETAEGASVEPTPTVDHLRNAGAIVDPTGSLYANQVIVRVNPTTDDPALLYLKGSQTPVPAYAWTYRRWDGDTWVPGTGLPTTDNAFDAADLWFAADGTAYAYVTTGGDPDTQATPEEAKLAARGGDLRRFTLTSAGTVWGSGVTVKESLNPAERYNNPQAYTTGNGTPGVMFSEWNNDASSFIHKLFLYRNGTLVGREFTPDVLRLAGANRIETSTKISLEAFPSGADTVVLASSQDYADALCGVPLAQSLRAPVLLCNPEVDGNGKLTAALETEIKRLKPAKIVLLGGENALSEKVKARIRVLRSSATVQRISGNNRYETALWIARELAAREGQPNHVMLASGANFADALAASPYAARQGIPVLLTSPAVLPPATKSALSELAPETVVIAGGPVAVSLDVESACLDYAATDRVAGKDRYETAAEIARIALQPEVGHTLERPVIASGATFADAVPGGLLAARYNTVVVLTAPGALPASSEMTLRGATKVLEAYVLGGSVAISPGVENRIAAVLTAVEAQ